MSNRMGYNGGRSYDFLLQPVTIDCNFVVDDTQPNGVRALKGAGVKNVYMYSSAPGASNPLTSSTYSKGYALIQLRENYIRYCGGFSGFVCPVTGSAVDINATALTVGQPYVITSVGTAANGAVTIAPTGSDSSGSLASTYFSLYDAFGNTFILYFYVTGIGGQAPAGVSGTPVQVTIAENASVDAQTTALSGVIALLNNSQSFTCSGGGTSTLTITSTVSGPLPGAPAAGAGSLGYPATYATTVYNTNLKCWQGVGVPPGVVPNVGVSFIATAEGVSTGGGSSGQVYAAGVSGITNIEVIGDANQSIGPIPMGGSPNVGGWILVQFLAPVYSDSANTMTPTAPAQNSVCGLTFRMEAKNVTIAGE